MPRSILALRITLIVLGLSLSLGPILYGLNLYDWDLDRVISINYTLPRIDFDSRLNDIYFRGGRLYIEYIIINMGEVNISITDLDASIYGLDGEYLADVYILESIDIFSGESETLIVYVDMDEGTISRFIEYIMGDGGRILLRGNLIILAFSSRVEYPLDITIDIPRKVLSMLIESMGDIIDVRVLDIDLANNRVNITIGIINNIPLEASIIGMEASLYTPEGDLIGDLQVLSPLPISIEPSKESTIRLAIELTGESIKVIYQYIAEGLERFRVKGLIVLDVLGSRIEVGLDVELPLGEVIGG